jgi:hypothetical protein
MRLVPLALKRFQDAHPGSPQFNWQAQPENRPTPLGDEASDLRVVHEVHTAGTFCSAGSSPLASSAK